MNELRPARSHLLLFVIAALGAFLMVGALVWIMVRVTQPEAVSAARADERRKALAQTRNEEAQVLNSYGPQGAGFVRMRIDDAMKLTVKEYQNAAAARSNLVARADKAGTPPPQPEAPLSKYE